MTLEDSEMQEPEQFSTLETWTIRVVMGFGMILFVAGAVLFVAAGLTLNWSSIFVALVYGAIPFTEVLVVVSFWLRRRPGRAAAAIWLSNLLNVWLIYNGAFGIA